MLYLDLAGVYLPFSLHSQTSLLYQTCNESMTMFYGPTTLYGAIVQDDLNTDKPANSCSHTIHCWAAYKQPASSTVSSNFTRRYYWNHSCFLFLRLLICLNSAGSLALFEADKDVESSNNIRDTTSDDDIQPSIEYQQIGHCIDTRSCMFFGNHLAFKRTFR